MEVLTGQHVAVVASASSSAATTALMGVVAWVGPPEGWAVVFGPPAPPAGKPTGMGRSPLAVAAVVLLPPASATAALCPPIICGGPQITVSLSGSRGLEAR